MVRVSRLPWPTFQIQEHPDEFVSIFVHPCARPALVATLVLAVAICSALSVRAGPAPAPAAGRQFTLTLEYAGAQREVSVYVPSSYVPGTPTPLVVALHGGSGSAAVMYAPAKRIVQHAESDGFVAVFPNGVPNPNAPNSNNYYWDDPVNIGYMGYLLDQAGRTLFGRYRARVFHGLFGRRATNL